MTTENSELAKRLVLHVIANAIAIAVTAWLLPGIEVVNNDLGTYVLIGAVFGLVNTFIKPLISCLSIALVVMTLGLFLFVINGLMLWITADFLPDRLIIDNFGWAILGGFIMAIVGTFLQTQFGLNDKNNSRDKVRVVFYDGNKNKNDVED